MGSDSTLKFLNHGVSMDGQPPSSMDLVLRNLRRPKKRLRLFELDKWLMCSIVGTCLGPPDIKRVTKRHKIRFEGDVREHQIHSFFVERAAENGPISRSLSKVLDEKFARTIKLVGQQSDDADLEQLWEDLCAKGDVAAAYWAFMSHSHIPDWLRNNIFGDVHMLSHFMGGHNRQNAKALWQAERQIEQLAVRLNKARQHAQDTIAGKDRQIGDLEKELKVTRQQLTSTYARMTKATSPSRTKPADRGRSERRLSSARARIRLLEQQNERMRHLLDAIADVDLSASLQPKTAGTQVEDDTMPPDLKGCQILYVGGRYQLVPHLRARVEALDACLLHHDGGKEETLKSLDGLVDQADVVFCPIDCISHQACLKAKHLCKRRAKPFVPLRSSSTSCFVRAIRMLEASGVDLEANTIPSNFDVNAQAE